MTQSDKILQPKDKFYFDLNNFDDNAEEEEISEEDLIPTFSEEELEAAKQEAYKQGKEDGLAEAAASREQQIAEILKRITQNFSSIISAENIREQNYEEEALTLCYSYTKKLFPKFTQVIGIDEVRHVILQTVQSHSNASKIHINVHPDVQGDIAKHINETLSEDIQEKVVIEADTQLDLGDCKIFWNDGGAVRDATQLSSDIIEHLEKLLPDKAEDSVQDQNSDIVQNKEVESNIEPKPDPDGENHE